MTWRKPRVVTGRYNAAVMNTTEPAPGLITSPDTRRHARATVVLVVLCQLVHGLTFSAIPLFLPLIRDDFSISYTQAGLLSAAATFSYALGQIPAGYLSDRYGPRRLIFIGLTGWSAFSLLLGLVHGFTTALLTQFLAGAFRALLFAPGLSLLTAWFPRERRALAISLYMVGGFAGTVVLSLAGPLLAAHFGWRAVFMGFATVGILMAFIFLRGAREKARDSASTPVTLNDLLHLARQPIMWICSALQFVRFAVVTAFNLWLPSLLIVDRGLSVQTAGLIVAMSAAFTAPSNAVGGYVSDRLRDPPKVIACSLAMLATTSLLLVSFDALPVTLMVIAVNSVFLQFYFGSLFLVPMEILGPRVAGTATGFANLFANIGGVCAAFALGAVKDYSGSFTWGFVGISLLCLAGVGLTLWMARIRRSALAR